jgi:hypothetical protein
MRSFIFTASSLLFLAGCPDVVIVDPPADSKPVRLESGRYSVLVTDVVSVSCDGLRADDLFGQQLPLDLFMARGGRAEANLGGFFLTGRMASGVLALDGELSPGPVGEDDDIGVAETEDQEADGDVRDEGEPAEEGGSSESAGCAPAEGDESEEASDRCEPDPTEDVERPDDVDAEERGGQAGSVSLELTASRTDHAKGFLAFSDRRCEVEVAVEVQAVDRDDDPVVVYETEEPGEEPIGCDDDEDCG